jgi:hypothetical protein
MENMEMGPLDTSETILDKLARISRFFVEYNHRFQFVGLDKVQRKLRHSRCEQMGVFHLLLTTKKDQRLH